MYYSSIGALSMILHLIINADTLFGKHDEANSRVIRKYRVFLIGIVLYYMSDFGWGLLLEHGFIRLVYADTVVYFLSMGLTVFLWVRYIAAFLELNRKWTRFLTGVGAFIFGSEALALIVNFFVPIMFHFNSDGEYVPSIARYIILYIQVVLFILISFDTLWQATKHEGADRLHYQTIGISGLIMAFFVFLQSRFPWMPFYAVGCLLATSIIHSFVVVEQRVESSRQLGQVMTAAYKDTLTSVRNKNAYTESRGLIDKNIKEGMIKEFAVVVFDLNDLKIVNDTKGHEAGDQYIKDGCSLICHTFRHSPVFRIGGDEFAAFLTNDDYMDRDELVKTFNEQVDANLLAGEVVVSAGISLYDAQSDSGYDDVFARADELMYIRKKELKKRKAQAAKS